MTRCPAVDPTVVLAGLNRSGTTALSQCFLNHPHVEVFKDPSKYQFESSSVPDFSHFFEKARFSSTIARVVKVSIGQYTTELCTIPIYPMLEERPEFLRRLYHVFVIRDPVALWTSWEAMTKWLQSTDDPAVIESWHGRQRDKGIEVGWGPVGLFDLAYRYLHQTLLYIHAIVPDRTFVIDFDDFQRRRDARVLISSLCSKVGLDFRGDMVDWRLPFGDSSDRLFDGIRRPIGDRERQYLHRTILRSDGLGSRDDTESAPDRPPLSADAIRFVSDLRPLYIDMRRRRLNVLTNENMGI